MNIHTANKSLTSILEDGLVNTAPAITLAVYHHNALILNTASGHLDPDERLVPTRPDTRFDLASVSKLFTATAFLMQLAEQRIGLYDPVSNIIPELRLNSPVPLGGGQDPHTLEPLPTRIQTAQYVTTNRISFRHLLTHTGGFAPWRDLFLNVGPVPPPPGKKDTLSRKERIRRAIDIITSYPLVDFPGESVNYSDLGLILLGEAITRLDRAPTLAQVIQRRILNPLGLKQTGYRPEYPLLCAPTELDLRWRGRRCQGEVHDENAASLGGIAGHAGVFSTAQEVARFGLQWLHAAQGRLPNWLPGHIAQRAIQQQAGDRGLGWQIKAPEGEYSSAGELFSQRSFGHTGFTGTSLWIDPERELVVALLTNRVYHGRDAAAITAFRPQVHDAICRWVDHVQHDNPHMVG